MGGDHPPAGSIAGRLPRVALIVFGPRVPPGARGARGMSGSAWQVRSPAAPRATRAVRGRWAGVRVRSAARTRRAAPVGGPRSAQPDGPAAGRSTRH